MSIFRIPGFTPYLLVVFLNAFIDLGHKILIQNTVFKIYDGKQQIILSAILNALILLPFIMSFTPAGLCADRYPKNLIMRWSAAIAVLLTLAITFCYYSGWFWAAFAMTFLLALQSAFYSPAKYGYIRELVGIERLAISNGAVQATTITAILTGLFIFSILFELMLTRHSYYDSASLLIGIAPIGWILVVLSIIEFHLCRYIPAKKQPQKQNFSWQCYLRADYLRRNFSYILHHEIILLSIIGLSIFWAISQVVVATFPAHAKMTMAITNTVIIQGIMAFAGLGIIGGSIFAGRISGKHIETGLIPVGCLGVSTCLIALPLLPNPALQCLNFFLWGFSGGLVLVPLNALIQFHAGENRLGKVLAGNNLVQNLFMFAFLLLTILFAQLGANSYVLFTLICACAIISTLFSIYKLPQSLLRFVISWIIGRHYKLEIQGIKNLPEDGGVLLLGNHISWLDWGMLQIACPRAIRFVMFRDIYERFYLKWLLDMFRCIPISPTRSSKTMTAINAALNAGEVVCVFPEGAISRTGQLGKFHRGFEIAANNATGVILPFYIHGMWSSKFGRANKGLRNLHRNIIKRDIIIAFGQPIPIDSPAEVVKSRVFELSMQAWGNYSHTLPAIAHAFIDSTSKNKFTTIAADTQGTRFNGCQLLVAAICFSRQIRRDSNDTTTAILLPSSSAALILNMAAFLAGRSVLNLNFTSSPEALQSAISQTHVSTIYTSRMFLDRVKKRGIDLVEIFSNCRILSVEDMAKKISLTEKITTLLSAIILPAWLKKSLFSKSISAQSLAVVMFTSGSEGQPKGVMLSHRNIMTNIMQIADVINFNGDEIILGNLPVFHSFGMTVTTYMPVLIGLQVVFHPDPTDTLNLAKAISRWNINIMCGTASFLRLYIENKKVHPLMLAPLRMVIGGGEKIPAEISLGFKQRFGVNVYEGYGTTETSPVSGVNIPDVLDTDYWHVQEGTRVNTVGLPLPGTSYRIVDPDTLKELPVGEEGLILIGGPQVMMGYLDNKEKTAAVILREKDGQCWYKTGDKGRLDEDGFLSIVDRYSRFAKIAGEMISLGAVEQSIRQALSDSTLELSAVNLPDPKKGERIVLLTTANYSLQEIRHAMKTQGIPGIMVPTALVQVAELPKLGSGKIDTSSARKIALEQQETATNE